MIDLREPRDEALEHGKCIILLSIQKPNEHSFLGNVDICGVATTINWMYVPTLQALPYLWKSPAKTSVKKLMERHRSYIIASYAFL